MRVYITLLVSSLLILMSCTSTEESDSLSEKKFADYDLSMYPESSDTLSRYIIELPIEEDEGLFNLEIWAGKSAKVDCNKHSLAGKFNRKTVQGWGYSYYVFETDGMMMSTQMACPEENLTDKVVRSKTEHVRYNSKLPVVVYCPKNIAIEYAIWSKSATPIKAILK